jgi:hypothetical protein
VCGRPPYFLLFFPTCSFGFYRRLSVCLCGFDRFFDPLRFLGAGWQRGQKWLLLPATITRRMMALHRKHGFPSR